VSQGLDSTRQQTTENLDRADAKAHREAARYFDRHGRPDVAHQHREAARRLERDEDNAGPGAMFADFVAEERSTTAGGQRSTDV